MTTNVYDTLGSPSQLGSDLQTFSSNGWSFTDTATHWDIVQSAGVNNAISQAVGMVDFCVHGGDLHAVWVEPQWNGSARVMRGPYVKKWNGFSWVALGGEVDPSITPLVLATNPNPSGAIGTRGAPARPKIASDGTDLYVGYTVREVATAPNPPPNGSYVPGQACGCYVGTCDLTDYTKWTPRKVYVRVWNSGASTWDLFGDLPSLTNNVLQFNDQLGGIANPFAEFELNASAGESGAVYVSFREGGVQSAVETYLTAPACIFGIQFGTTNYSPQLRYGLRVAKYTAGTGAAGTVKTIASETSPTGTTISYTGTGYSPNGSAYVGNDTGIPYVFWTTRTVVFKMTNWTTLVDAQSLNPVSPYFGVFAYGFAHDSSTSKYYTEGGSGVFQTADDGATPSEGLDFPFYGLTYYDSAGASFTDKIVADMGHGNLWAVGANNPFSALDGHLIQYHHECPAWVNWGFVTGNSATQGVVGEPIPTKDGDIIYTVGAYRDPSSTATDLKIQVYKSAINRNAASCGVVQQPFLNNWIRQSKTEATGGTGAGSHPFVDVKIETGSPDPISPSGATGDAFLGGRFTAL